MKTVYIFRVFVRICLYGALAYAATYYDTAHAADMFIEPDIKAAAERYHLDPIMFKSLLIVESNLNYKAINPITLDYGIGQINYKTAEAYGIDLPRLTKDRAYSLDRAAFILSTHKRIYSRKLGKVWICSYNQGGVIDLDRCKTYLRRLSNAHNLVN